MTEPDYTIEERFDDTTIEVYYKVFSKGGYLFSPRFGTLEEARNYVRMLRKYSQRIFHYVED